jgi:hypothetical protein
MMDAPNEIDIVPTKRGAALTFDEWEELKCVIPRVEERLGEQIRNVEYCENSNSHQNPMGFLQCSRCSTKEYSNYTY